MLRAMLRADKNQEWEITEAASGAEVARTMATNQAFDAVLLDVQMPDMDGFAVCKALREVDKQVPVLFVTADRGSASFGKGHKAGGDSYLVKPVSQTTLKSALDVLTTLRRRS